MAELLFIVLGAALTGWAALCVVLTVIGLPGMWLMALTAVGLKGAELYWPSWSWLPDQFPVDVSWWVVVGAIVLSVIGELLESLASAVGAGKAGASKRAIFGSIVGGLLGLIVGQILIPIPLVGALIGSIVGAGVIAGTFELTKARQREVVLNDGVAQTPSSLADEPAGEDAQGDQLSVESSEEEAVPFRRWHAVRSLRVAKGAAVGKALSVVLKGGASAVLAIVMILAAWIDVL